MASVMWNLWHGCHKYSEGCQNCYVYRGDAKRGIDSTLIHKTLKFDLPILRNRKGEYKYPSGTFFWTCFTSDFLLKETDEWRIEAWKMIKERSDCHFLFITKRIERFIETIPDDWGDGYDNVTICSTCESQKQIDNRMPIFKEAPIKHKVIILEPLLTEIDLAKYLDETIEQVVVGGESGMEARDCHYDWILKIREQCIAKNVTFVFKQTGTYLIKDGKKFKVDRREQHSQARKANINYKGKGKDYLSR